MIVGLVLMIVCNVSALGGAWTLASKVRLGRPGADAVLFLLVHLTLISTIVLVAGITGLLQPIPLG
ncbi:MAG TPA: hypothetical protein VG457_09630, partial [Planctomycetota bacterium]|nr:hypothetical protein [Planctomycetota bacterium]